MPRDDARRMLVNDRTVRRTIMARHARLPTCLLVCALIGPATALALPSYQATFLPSGFAGQDINDADHSLSDTALDCNPFFSSSRPPMYNPDVAELPCRVINAAVNPMEPWGNIAEFFPSETNAA